MNNICSICNKNPVRVSGKRYQSYCEDCNKQYQRKYYNNEKVRYNGNRKSRLVDLKAFVDSTKFEKPCADCGYNYPSFVMDYDHRDPSKKIYSISSMRSRRFSVENIQKEIDKCDLVCANCHRVRTHKLEGRTIG